MKWKQTTKSDISLASKHSDLAWELWTFDNLRIKVFHFIITWSFSQRIDLRLIKKRRKKSKRKKQKVKGERRKQNEPQESIFFLLCLSFSLSFSLFAFLLHHLTISYCVASCWGAASPSAMLLDLWFPVKHNESYIRVCRVRWCTICSQALKTLSNREQQKATATPVSSEYSYSRGNKKPDDFIFKQKKSI